MVFCCVLCVRGRALGVSDQEYSMVCCCELCVRGRALGASVQEYSIVCVALYHVLEAEPLVVSHQDYSRAKCRCACTALYSAVYYVMEAEPLVFLTKIIQGCELWCNVCWERTLGVSYQDDPRV